MSRLEAFWSGSLQESHALQGRRGRDRRKRARQEEEGAARGRGRGKRKRTRQGEEGAARGRGRGKGKRARQGEEGAARGRGRGKGKRARQAAPLRFVLVPRFSPRFKALDADRFALREPHADAVALQQVQAHPGFPAASEYVHVPRRTREQGFWRGVRSPRGGCRQGTRRCAPPSAAGPGRRLRRGGDNSASPKPVERRTGIFRSCPSAPWTTMGIMGR